MQEHASLIKEQDDQLDELGNAVSRVKALERALIGDERSLKYVVVSPTFYPNTNDVRFELGVEACRRAKALGVPPPVRAGARARGAPFLCDCVAVLGRQSAIASPASCTRPTAIELRPPTRPTDYRRPALRWLCTARHEARFGATTTRAGAPDLLLAHQCLPHPV